MNPKVDAVILRSSQWRKAFEQLRPLLLDTGLDETVKWGQACYTYQGKNIVLMHGFKDYCALLFFKGALLKDKAQLLIQQTPNVQAARQLRFTSAAEISRLAKTVKTYIYEAIEVEKAGLTVTLKKTAAFAMPEELKKKLKSQPALKKAFEALTPGRQRAYLLFFSGAKQSATRQARIEKYAPRILQGKGLND